MNDVWKHDMFEITEKHIAESFQPVELYLSNLDELVVEQDIFQLFSAIGRLRKVSMHFDISGRPLGIYIFPTYMSTIFTPVM